MFYHCAGRLSLPLFRALFLFILSLPSIRSEAQCSVTSSLSGSTFSNNTSVGSFSWSSISNVSLSDNGRASNGILLAGLGASANTSYVVVQDFGFGIPTGAAICGIEVTIERRATGLLIGSSIRDNSIRLVKNNVITGSNMASGSNWPGSDGNRVYGSVSDTWGSSWTQGDINAANFGVAISARLSSGLASLFLTAEIDLVSVRVFYNLVLPVQLVSFKAIQNEDKVNLEWATASESNNDHFTIERSTDGVSGWHVVGSITGSEESNKLRYYNLTDNDPLPVNFYRVRQTDNDGSSTFSGIVKVQFNGIKKDLQVFPNPIRSNGEMTVMFPGKVKEVQLKNILGKKIMVKNVVALAEGIKVRLPELENGYYWLVIQTAQNTYTKKILVLSN